MKVGQICKKTSLPLIRQGGFFSTLAFPDA